MSPPPFAASSSAALLQEPDPVRAALRSAPLAEEPISDEELAMAEAAIAEIRSGTARTVPHTEVHATLDRMRRERRG